MRKLRAETLLSRICDYVICKLAWNSLGCVDTRICDYIICKFHLAWNSCVYTRGYAYVIGRLAWNAVSAWHPSTGANALSTKCVLSKHILNSLDQYRAHDIVWDVVISHPRNKLSPWDNIYLPQLIVLGELDEYYLMVVISRFTIMFLTFGWSDIRNGIGWYNKPPPVISFPLGTIFVNATERRTVCFDWWAFE